MKIIENERQVHRKQFAFCKQIRKKERSYIHVHVHVHVAWHFA